MHDMFERGVLLMGCLIEAIIGTTPWGNGWPDVWVYLICSLTHTIPYWVHLGETGLRLVEVRDAIFRGTKKEADVDRAKSRGYGWPPRLLALSLGWPYR